MPEGSLGTVTKCTAAIFFSYGRLSEAHIGIPKLLFNST